MSRQRIYVDSREGYNVHRLKLSRKIERIEGLRALVNMWEERPNDVDPDYLRELRDRLHIAEKQLAAMRP